MKGKESLLHFVWQYKLFNTHALRGTLDEKIDILHFGEYNTNSGPDFSFARIRVDGVEWVGNIELHVYSSDYHKHKHQHDEAYQSIILHVVYEHDALIPTLQCPTLELKSYIAKGTLTRYECIETSVQSIPCCSFFKMPEAYKYHLFAQKVCFERLEHKISEMRSLWQYYKNDWNKLAFIYLGAYMGNQVNKEAFSSLLQYIESKWITRYCKRKIQTEALLIGVSGLLFSTKWGYKEGTYIQLLKNEYAYIKEALQIKGMKGLEWKFSRMRPPAFPTVRLSQLAHILFMYPNLFDEVVLEFDFKTIYEKLDVQCNVFWGGTNTDGFTLGKAAINILIINAIVPLMYLYGRESGSIAHCERAMDILHALPAEENRYTKRYKEIGFEIYSALHSQAILELQKKYCSEKACLQCSIGYELLRNTI